MKNLTFGKIQRKQLLTSKYHANIGASRTVSVRKWGKSGYEFPNRIPYRLGGRCETIFPVEQKELFADREIM